MSRIPRRIIRHQPSLTEDVVPVRTINSPPYSTLISRRTISPPSRIIVSPTQKVITSPSRITALPTQRVITSPSRATSSPTRRVVTSPSRTTSSPIQRVVTSPSRATSSPTRRVVASPSRTMILTPSETTITTDKKVYPPTEGEVDNILKGITIINPEKINRKRKYIGETLINERLNGDPDPDFIDSDDLKMLFNLYDTYFFGNRLTRLLNENNSTLTFDFNPRLTRTIGRCSKKGCTYKIDFSWSQIDKISDDPDPRNRQMGGVPCETRVKCLQQVMEHELIHLLLNLQGFYKERHGPKFRFYLSTFFNQTEIKHKHFKEEEEGRLTREDAEINMRVTWTSKDGTTKIGTIVKINPKKALVDTGQGSSYRVPYSMLIQLFPGDPGYETIGELRQSAQDFEVGDRVEFKYQGETLTGTITKINPLRASIISDDQRFKGLAPYSALTKLSSRVTSSRSFERVRSPERIIKPSKEFEEADRVQFEYKGKIVTGTITRVNPSRISITSDDGTFRGLVPPRLLTKLAQEKVTRQNAYVGTRVNFIYKNEVKIGTITKLNPKTARVVTDDKSFSGLVDYGFLRVAQEAD